MFDHLGLKAKNLSTSKHFYKAALAPLGLVPDESGTGFGPKGAPALWLGEGTPTRNVHIAFTAKNHAAVDDFHKASLKAGGKDNGAPGPRPDYGPKYYAAFLVDADGNNIEAVCLK